jgi:proteasome-associated ATPase
MPRTANEKSTATSSPRPQADSHLQARTKEFLNLLVNGPDEVHPAVLEHLKNCEPGTARELVAELARQQREARQALGRADQALAEHQELLRELSRPPLLEAAVVAVQGDGTYVVAVGAYNRQEVVAHPDLEDVELQVGDVVGLSQENHVIVKRLEPAPRGRVARVQSWFQDQLLVEVQPEQTIAVIPSAAVLDLEPRTGDRVLIHEGWALALNVVERADDEPDDDFDPVKPDEIGGLDDQLDEVMLALVTRFLYPERAAEIGLEPLSGLVLEGPPGSGKTLIARMIATVLTTVHGQRVKFINVAPGAWRDPFYGVSDHKVVAPLERAERLLAEGRADLVILFYDELDTLGSRSADVTSRIDSRVLSALLHRMDGILARHLRSKILFIGATNRTDLLDEALLRPGRFGDLILPIPRPDREAARAIFRCHLDPGVRFWTNGQVIPGSTMVEQCAEAALARLFVDADPADALAELVLAGGQRRPVYAPEILSGALIASLVRRAKRLALRRGLIGPPGLIPDDFARAADEELDAIAARLVDPFKIREILGDRSLSVVHGVPRRRNGTDSSLRAR